MINPLPASAPIVAVTSLAQLHPSGVRLDVDAAQAEEASFDDLLGPIGDAGMQSDPESAAASMLDVAATALAVAAPSPPAAAPAPDALLAAMLDALSMRPAPAPAVALLDTVSAELPEAPITSALGGMQPAGETTLRGPQSPSQLLAAMLALRLAPATGGLAGAPESLDASATPTIDSTPDADGTPGSRGGILDLLAFTAAPVATPLPTTTAVTGFALSSALPAPIVVQTALDATAGQSSPVLASSGESPLAGVQINTLASALESPVDGRTFTAGVGTPAGASMPQGGAQALRADGALPQIVVPFNSPQWGNELASRVVTMSREQFSQAEIRVTPDELGPIEITLRFDGEKVHAHFGAVTPEAREALNSNMHRLRELLSSEGLDLGQSFVGHQGGGERRTHDSDGFRLPDAGGDVEQGMFASAPAAVSRSGLLDEFA